MPRQARLDAPGTLHMSLVGELKSGALWMTMRTAKGLFPGLETSRRILRWNPQKVISCHLKEGEK
jgi:hypothetical protein